MDIKNVRKQVNKKLKVYRLSYVGIISTTIAANLTTDFICMNYLSGMPDAIISGLLTGSMAFASIQWSIKQFKHMETNEKELLKSIKKELKTGQNRFEDTEIKDFDVEFAKQYLKKIQAKTK